MGLGRLMDGACVLVEAERSELQDQDGRSLGRPPSISPRNYFTPRLSKTPSTMAEGAVGGAGSWESFCARLPYAENNVLGGQSQWRACHSKTYEVRNPKETLVRQSVWWL
jgi:hypothetical protein